MFPLFLPVFGSTNFRCSEGWQISPPFNSTHARPLWVQTGTGINSPRNPTNQRTLLLCAPQTRVEMTSFSDANAEQTHFWAGHLVSAVLLLLLLVVVKSS